MKLEIRDHVAVVTMNAGKANAIGREWLDAACALLDEVSRSGTRALVLAGHGGFFSAGFDLPSLVGLSRPEMTAFMNRVEETMLRLFELPRPVVGAIDGHAIAGGCVLALQCDERLMADGPFKIGLNETALGLALPSCAIETLRCQVPASSLLPVALEGKLLLPREALALGLVQAVVPPGEVLDRALARAHELAQVPQSAWAHVKSLLRGPAVAAVKAAAARGETERWVEGWFSPEGQERVQAAVARLTRKK